MDEGCGCHRGGRAAARDSDEVVEGGREEKEGRIIDEDNRSALESRGWCVEKQGLSHCPSQGHVDHELKQTDWEVCVCVWTGHESTGGGEQNRDTHHVKWKQWIQLSTLKQVTQTDQVPVLLITSPLLLLHRLPIEL